jgi:flagellar hook-associated protein 2
MSSLETYSVSLNDYLNQYLSYVRQPITRLQIRKSDLEVKSAIFTDLTAKLNALDDVLDRLSGTSASSVFRSKTVTTSNGAVATGSATSEAVAGSHTVFVTQLAKAHTVVSNRYGQEGTSLSQAHSGTKAFSITLGAETYDVSVTIAAGETDQTVLANIAAAINDATDGKVGASVVADTPSTAKLSIRSGTSGTAGAMTFLDTDGLLGSLGATNASQATDTVGGYVYADLGGNELDALLVVDGINVISSSNILENAVGGLTITLLAEQDVGDSPATLTVSVDVETMKSELENFLTAYNDVFSYLVEKTRVNGITYERGVLSTDFPFISLRMNMRQAMNTLLAGSDYDYGALSQIGITSNRTGSFSISDEGLLDEVLSAETREVEDLFASDGGIATALASLISTYTAPSGAIATSQEGIRSRIDMIDDRIDRQEAYVRLREEDLRRQYAALQEALYTLEMTQSITRSFSSLVGL